MSIEIKTTGSTIEKDSVVSTGVGNLFSVVMEEDSQYFEMILPNIGVIRTRIPVAPDGRIVMPSGATPIFRTTIAVDPVQVYDNQGRVVQGAQVTPYSTVGELLLRVTNNPRFATHIRKISHREDPIECEQLLRSLILKCLNELPKPITEWEKTTSFEQIVQQNTFVLLDGKFPPVKGEFMPDIEGKRRLAFFDYLVDHNLTRYAATQTGHPGKTADRTDKFGYPFFIRNQPLAYHIPLKRYATQRGTSHVLEIGGKDYPLVKMQGIKSIPPMCNMNVAAMDMGLNDAVVISQSAADKLTVLKDDVRSCDIDTLINLRGGLVSKGRNHRLVYKANKVRSLLEWKHVPSVKKYMSTRLEYIGMLKSMRTKWDAKFATGDVLVDYGYEAMSNWWNWLHEQPEWIAARQEWNHLNQPIIRTFERCKIERAVTVGLTANVVRYICYNGVESIPPSDGMKIQSEADLFKGVATILPDNCMPWIRYNNNDKVRADVVCDMGDSAKKHGSLKLAHLTMVLNKIAADCGGLELDRRMLATKEQQDNFDAQIVGSAQLHGYKDDNLTCEVLDVTGKKVLGIFPAGIIRVGRHTQDAEVQGGVVGDLPKDTSNLRSSLKQMGKRDGFIDTMVQVADGFPEMAKELRRVPEDAEQHLEQMRAMIILAPKLPDPPEEEPLPNPGEMLTESGYAAHLEDKAKSSTRKKSKKTDKEIAEEAAKIYKSLKNAKLDPKDPFSKI